MTGRTTNSPALSRPSGDAQDSTKDRRTRSGHATRRRQLLRGIAIGFVGTIAGCSQSAPTRQVRKLAPPDGGPGDNFGNVAISGETVVFGAPGHASSSGAAYAFVRTDGTWHMQAKLIIDTG
ncbi:MAG: FG-GAP repeat protein, partial [Salinirussus sp.]